MFLIQSSFVIKKWGCCNGIPIYWVLLDGKRNTYNVANRRVFVNENYVESTAADVIDILSNGFKIKNTDAQYNGSGLRYIFMAFAEFPFKYSNAR